MLHEWLLGAGELVFLRSGFTHEPSRVGRKRATRAAPDKAWLRTPLRALYQRGVAPCLRRHFLPGWRYAGRLAGRSAVCGLPGQRGCLAPVLFEIGGAGLNRLLDVARGAFHRVFHLLELRRAPSNGSLRT